jgi:NADPH2:quinone reductase
MKAMVLNAYGEPSGFSLQELPMPVPASGEVLVRVEACGINPADTKMRQNGPHHAPRLPAVLGLDLAGTIVQVGQDVQGWQVGDEVYGCAGGVRGLPGTNAEYIAVDPQLLAPKPRSISMRDAAALPLVAITAWLSLFERAKIEPGQSVLVYGGIGGVSHIAVQLAAWHGARVVATASSNEKAQLLRQLGANEVVDYRVESTDQFVTRLTGGLGFDVVLDAVGGSNLQNAFLAARENGTVVCISARSTYDLTRMHANNLSLHVVFMLLPLITGRGRFAYGAILRNVAKLVDGGAVRPIVDPRRWGLEDLATAHTELENGTVFGKAVLEVAPQAAAPP